MNIISIMNKFSNEQTTDFATKMKQADHASRLANEANALLKVTPKTADNYKEVREKSIIAGANKADAIKSVQEIVDAVFVGELLKGETPVECFRAYFSDPFRPVLSIKGKNCMVSWDNDESVSLFSFKYLLTAMNEHYKDAMSMDIRKMFMDARSVTSAYVLHQCLSNAETMKTYKAEYLSQFGQTDGFVTKDNVGRNKSEKAMQTIINTLLGLTDEEKVVIRITKDFIMEFYLFDHGFDRDLKTGKAFLIDTETFMERLAVKISKAYTKQTDIAKIQK